MPAFAQDLPASFAAIVERRVAQAEVPGCIAVALVAETVQTKFACSPGAGRVELNEHSLFEIGSITKGFTGLLLADMVRNGEVSLDDPVSKHARPGAKLPRRGEEEITLRDLVTHTSGLPRLPPKFNPANPQDPYADFSADSLYDALAVTELHGQKGRYEYSNFGYMWLSEMLARRGASFEALLAERVLAPLGLKDTVLTLTPEQEKRFVAGHDAFYEVTPHWRNGANLEGAGMLRSSLADMVKLAQALSGRRETPLKETISLALEPLRASGGTNSTGYGWVTSERPGARVRWHNGGTGGFRSMVAVNAGTQTAAVVLVDSVESFDDLALHLVDSQVPLRTKRVALKTDAESLKEYAGRYELTPTFAIEFFLEGSRFMTQGTGQRAFEIFRESTDAFFTYVVDAKVRFTRDAGGQVDGLILDQGGRERKAKRVPAAR